MSVKLGHLAIMLFTAIGIAVPVSAADDAPPPYWAFAIGSYATEETRKGQNDDIPLHVPNSDVVMTRKQTLDIFNVPDWHPDQHPPAPDVVMRGKKPNGYSCAYCHYANGMGLPESASIAGFSVDYITQQFRDYRSGARSSVLPDMISFKGMATLAKNTSDEDLKVAATYFASLKPRKWIRVIEGDTVPKTKVAEYLVQIDPAGGTEPIGNRILEVPESATSYDLHDDGAGFIDYVPAGSIKKGERLAKTGGNGKTQPCASCHGANLKGMGVAPPIAGRIASNIVRQLYNIQHGKRTAPEVMPMWSVAAKLSQEDMVDLAAYLASRDP